MKTEMQNKPVEKCNWSNLNYGGKKRKLEYIPLTITLETE